MRVGEIKLSPGREYGGNDFGPFSHIRQPANRSPRREHEIERTGCQARGLIDGTLDEVGLQACFVRQTSRDVECRAGEIEPGRDGAAPHEAQRIAADMALQMQDAFSGNVAEFGGFDRVQGVLARTKPVEHVVAVAVARMDRDALIPVPAIDLEEVIHADFMRHPTSPRKHRRTLSSAAATGKRLTLLLFYDYRDGNNEFRK